jgi:NADH-quinone oxidoreductase subunit L
MTYQQYIYLIPLLPLASFVLLGLFGRAYFGKSAGVIATGSMLLSTVLSFYAAYQYFFVNGKAAGVYQQLVPLKMEWLRFTSGISINMGILLDAISVMMLVVVSFVSLMVHLFSLGYLKGEKRFATYFSFLSLFTFSMLGLVLSSNLFQIYIFWELVGVSSYLLIGFYFEKPSAVAASKKAFIVTRFADLGFLIGILILGFGAGSFDFGTIIERLTAFQSPQFAAMTAGTFFGLSALTWGLLLVFVGGAGKSAMFPLHIWLPDAMEGPTPVSALIHAATMVVAGVYLVARLFPLYALDTLVVGVVTWVGALSALFAAVIACTQTDIKRVLAYSTMSQIGFMMFALGVARMDGESSLGFTASLFHLFTHAFFKSLLFLCAGAIIHFVHSNDMRDMGGLRKLMPLTHAAFLIACLAISGIPPFAGFFSKEEILLAAFNANKPVFFLGLFTSALTAFYMFRLYFSVFWNKPLDLSRDDGHHGEGTFSMKLPLIILSLCTIIAGFIPFAGGVTADGKPMDTHFSLQFSLAPVGLAVLAIFLAASFYKTANEKPARLAAGFGPLYRTAAQKFYIDEIYLFITRRVLFNLVGRPAAWIDRNIIDGAINATGYVTARTAQTIRGLQSGSVQNYALLFFCGVAALAVLFIYLWK